MKTLCFLKINLVAVIGTLAAAPAMGQGHSHALEDPRSIQNGPRAYFESKVIDLGDVFQNERTAGTFTIENFGNEDLEIRELAAHCGCTVLELDESQRIVPPDGKREITVFFNSEDRQGLQRKLVTVFTNDPEYPMTDLVIRSNVLGSFKVLPAQYVAMVDARPGDRLETLSVYPTVEGTTLESLEINVPGNVLEYALESIVNDDGVGGIGVSFSVADEAEFGPIDLEIRFDGTVDGKPHSIWGRAVGSIVGPIDVRPDRLESTHPTPRGRSFAPITLRPTDGKTFNVLSIDAGPYFEHSQAPGKEIGDVDIALKLKDEAPDGPLATTAEVRTDHPDMPIVQFPVFVDVLPRCRVQPAGVLIDQSTLNRPRRIRLQSDMVSALEIQSASCDNPQFEVKVIDASSDYPKIRFVEVRWASDQAPAKGVVSDLNIKTNVPSRETITVPLEFRID
ncbi:MAG: DUF1573 domain-containing protein [Phycisphaerales bacterium]|nr:DUF1573 domain-containing protein [Phycisphaerales bacterium]